MNIILHAWNAGHVQRWHCNPQLAGSGDSDAGHQQRCTILLLLFFPDATREEIIDMVTHDQGEINAGDMAYPIKLRHPEFSKTLQGIENESIQNQGLPVFHLDGGALIRRKWIDMLESYCWMMKHCPTMSRKTEWQEQFRMLYANAYKLGVQDRYTDFMEAFQEYYNPGMLPLPSPESHRGPDRHPADE